MIIKKESELNKLCVGGALLGRVLGAVSDKVKPGVSTQALNDQAEKLIKIAGAMPSFKGYKSGGRTYPAALCVSVNDEIVHALPSGRKLKEGDIVGLDLGIIFQGLFTDMAVTVGVGRISEEAADLIKITKKALKIAVRHSVIGNHIGDIGYAVQSHVEGMGYEVVRELVGHGVGGAVHEEPEVPNWGKKGQGPELKKGMVLALEPMVTLGDYKIVLDEDGWTWKTKDGSLSAHFEQTIVVAKSGPLIVTPQPQ